MLFLSLTTTLLQYFEILSEGYSNIVNDCAGNFFVRRFMVEDGLQFAYVACNLIKTHCHHAYKIVNQKHSHE